MCTTPFSCPLKVQYIIIMHKVMLLLFGVPVCFSGGVGGGGGGGGGEGAVGGGGGGLGGGDPKTCGLLPNKFGLPVDNSVSAIFTT